VPDGWQAPPELAAAGAGRPGARRELQWTLLGEEHELVERLALTGARVRDVRPMSLEEAALAVLAEEVTP